MYPTIYDLVADLLGLHLPFLKAIQSFGFFVALAFIAAAYFFAQELKRKQAQGLVQTIYRTELKGGPLPTSELITQGIVGFLLGYKGFFIAQNWTAFLDNTQGFILSSAGSFLGGLITAAAFVGYALYQNKDQKDKQAVEVKSQVEPHELVSNMTLIAAVAGILGAKIFHNLENWDDFVADPIGSLLSFSGLTMYGGLIVGSIAVLYYAHKQGLSLRHVADACAPGLMLAYGVGRIGCQVSGDGDWGINNTAPMPNWLGFLPDWFWSYTYPHNVNSVGIPIPGCEGLKHCNELPIPVFPTPLYEAIACIALFGVLWAFRKKLTVPGLMFCVYLMLNGFERFWIEKIRVNTTYQIAGHHITQAEIISTCLFIGGVVGAYLLMQKHKKEISNTVNQ